MTATHDLENTLSIGELSQLTGISTHTLRVWEKRYGSPEALRLPSGHRRYPRDEVARLRAVSQAVESGYRPSKVVTQSLVELNLLMGKKTVAPEEETSETDKPLPLFLNDWYSAVTHFDEQGLTQGFYDEWGRRGPLGFVRDCATPFMVGVGDRWAEGEFSVGQEHFASERLSDFLAAQWRRLNERNKGTPFVLTTLPGDNHRVGLQMAAMVTALADRRVAYIGPNTPLEDILTVTQRVRAEALCLSVSSSLDGETVSAQIQKLRQRLPDKIHLITGGAGAPHPAPNTLRFSDFDDYYCWLRQAP